jgi:RNA polymerase subunit RPABC4/transcription elongation factor Spt4
MLVRIRGLLQQLWRKCEEMTTRRGICSNCGTEITLACIKAEYDSNRFYWGDTVMCPICSLREVKMEIVV